MKFIIVAGKERVGKEVVSVSHTIDVAPYDEHGKLLSNGDIFRKAKRFGQGLPVYPHPEVQHLF